MMGVEDGIERRRLEGSHVARKAAHIHVNVVVRAMFERGGKQAECGGGQGGGHVYVAGGKRVGGTHGAGAVPQRVGVVVRVGVGRGQSVVRRVLPIPVRETEVHVADQLSKNAFVEIQVSPMPGKEVLRAVHLQSWDLAADVAVDVSLLQEAAGVRRICRIQRPHGLVGGFHLGDFRTGQGRGWAARL